MLIARDDRCASTGQRSRQHVVGGVAADRGLERVQSDDRKRVPKQREGRPGINRALTELRREDLAELVQQRLGRRDLVLADAVLEDIAAGAMRDRAATSTLVSSRSLTTRA